MNAPLISVIVPIYNVEKYVRKCLESLRGQTLKQIEVICIDDGSTDSSGAIADEYCNTDAEGNGKEWPVIRVIHTENCGLSAARNRGIDEARSEWLMFVDSDDWVEPGFCEIPYRDAIENHADMVIFRAEQVRDGVVQKPRISYTSVGIVDEITAHEFGGWAVWNKLYKRALFDYIRYPEGMVYEDYATTHKLVHIANTIVLVRECLYHYIYRIDSISNTNRSTDSRDSFYSKSERYFDLLSYGYPENKVDSLKGALLSAAFRYLTESKPDNNGLHIKAVEVLHLMDVSPESLSLKYKIALKAWNINQTFFVFLATRYFKIKEILNH